MGAKSILQSMKSGGTVFKHSEYICDVLSPGTSTDGVGFKTMEPFVVNPGNLVTFPWGSNIANCFEEYRMRGVVFEFRTLCTENASGTNPSMGAVIMGTKYNTLQSGFDSKMEMENYEYTTSCKPSQSMMHPINCKGITNKLFINTGAKSFSSEADRRLYDLAAFSIATNGLQALKGQALGELWVHYEVVLYKPKLITDNASLWMEAKAPLPYGGTNAKYLDGAIVTTESTMAGTFPIGGVDPAEVGAKGFSRCDSNGANETAPALTAADLAAGNVYLFPPTVTEGQFQVNIRWAGTTAAGAIAFPKIVLFSRGSGGEFPSLFGDTAIAFGNRPYWQNWTTKNVVELSFDIDINGPNCGFSFQTLGGSTDSWMTATQVSMVINEIGGTYIKGKKVYSGYQVGTTF